MKNYPRGPVYIEHADGSVSGLLEDIFQQSPNSVKDVQNTVSQGSDFLLNQVLQSPQFKRVVSEIEKASREAIRKEASENAWNLFLLAVAGGAIGGAVLRGTTGAIAAGLLAVYAFSQISNTDVSTEISKQLSAMGIQQK